MNRNILEMIDEDALSNNKYLITLVVLIFMFKIITWRQAERFRFCYMKNSMMEDFLNTT